MQPYVTGNVGGGVDVADRLILALRNCSLSAALQVLKGAQ
jgi:hypothetical protein